MHWGLIPLKLVKGPFNNYEDQYHATREDKAGLLDGAIKEMGFRSNFVSRHRAQEMYKLIG